ncbi:hypothetical protein AVEN_128682-1, partial [Araneus ventricosus]
MLPVDGRQLVKRGRRVVETEEERSRRLSTMVQRGQDRKKQKNKEIADCQTGHNLGRREDPRKQKNKEIDDW